MNSGRFVVGTRPTADSVAFVRAAAVWAASTCAIALATCRLIRQPGVGNGDWVDPEEGVV